MPRVLKRFVRIVNQKSPSYIKKRYAQCQLLKKNSLVYGLNVKDVKEVCMKM